MNVDSLSTDLINKLSSGRELDLHVLEDDIERIELDGQDETGEVFYGCKRPSIYVDAFEQMINTVRQHESHLLSEDEWVILDRYAHLSYHARYCLVRLVLRKYDKWHTVPKMEKFKREVGEEGLFCALNDLCQPLNSGVKVEPMDVDPPIKQEQEIIDLTCDTQPDDVNHSLLIPVEPHLEAPTLEDILSDPDSTDFGTLKLDFFCEDEGAMSLSDILWTLKLEDLKTLSKAVKVKSPNSTKPWMIYTLLRHASTQTVLDYDYVPSPKAKKGKKKKDDGFRQTKLSFFLQPKPKSPPETQEKRLREMALMALGKCVRVNPDFHKLIVRVNIIYDRANDYPKGLLLPAILTTLKIRVYPDYKYSRDGTIWCTRDEILRYVEALQLDTVIERELEPAKTKGAPKTPLLQARNKAATPATGGPSCGVLATPRKTPGAVRATVTPVNVKEELKPDDVVLEDECIVEESIKDQKARRVKEFFDTVLFPKWKILVTIKQDQEYKKRTPGLERFEPGFVYTRIFGKVTHALATLKDFVAEATVLEALLGQRLWRRGRRGRWYERRALIYTKYLCVRDNNTKDESVLRRIMDGIQEALKDDDTGIVYRPKLIRRLRALEKHLKVPEYERCRYEGELRKTDVVSFCAVRVWDVPTGLDLDATGRLKRKSKENNGSGSAHPDIISYLPVIEKDQTTSIKGNKIKEKAPTKEWKWKGKSIWKGRDDEHVNVETRALQYYEDLGYKGFHAESRILTTIFALLFWDIIFAEVPGAFETAFQDRPLDMNEDSFYYARRDLIEQRLSEIRDGVAQGILERHDDKYREKKTWCVGVQWDMCEKQDLLEIVKCLGGGPLSIICRLFCEDYSGRSSGVPDLVVWNDVKLECKFVEVKGPGDTAQENQKLWFDSLLGAGAAVELCKVIDENDAGQMKPQKSITKRKSKAKARPGDSGIELESEGEHEDQLPRFESPLIKKRSRPLDDDEDYKPSPPTMSPLSGQPTEGARAIKKQRIVEPLTA
ncbi:VRR-NUC domain-containing protein [Collybia nuda]|uniref:Fanconi-associated nuclease n=1 Tax=Collybia nuda TaxID=64659 RepID=A0A9P5YIR9_9AGAR|nr:VRR-NUC domain-containing protein [Collybia nuda]